MQYRSSHQGLSLQSSYCSANKTIIKHLKAKIMPLHKITLLSKTKTLSVYASFDTTITPNLLAYELLEDLDMP